MLRPVLLSLLLAAPAQAQLFAEFMALDNAPFDDAPVLKLEESQPELPDDPSEPWLDPAVQLALDKSGRASAMLVLPIAFDMPREARMEAIAEVAPAVLRLVGEDAARTYAELPVVAATLTEETLAAVLESGLVVAIEDNTPVPPMLDDTVRIIQAERVHQDRGEMGVGAAVAILDSGVDAAHEFFGGRVVDEACFSTTNGMQGSTSVCPNGQGQGVGQGAPCGIDGCDHGTHVAGIAAGAGDDFTGVAPGAGIVAVQVFSRFDRDQDCNGDAPCIRSFPSDQMAALTFLTARAAQLNIASANLSLGLGANRRPCGRFSAYRTTVRNAQAAGIATVASAGNDGVLGIGSPACIIDVFSVGATENDDDPAGFSQNDTFLDYMAPGVDVLSSTPNDCYGDKSGTSMAAPHVAGAFAVLRGFQTQARVGVLADALRNGVGIIDDHLGERFFSTRIDVWRALAAIDSLAPLAPEDLQVDGVVGTTVNLSWLDNADDELRFEIYGRTGYSSIVPERVPAATGWARVTGAADRLDPARTYHFKVRACNAQGRCSPFTSEVSATTEDTRPDPVTGLRVVDVTVSEIEIAWDPRNDIDTFVLHWTGGGNSGSLARAPGSPSFRLVNRAQNTPHSFTVRACKDGLCSVGRSIQATTLLAAQPPPAPSNLRLVQQVGRDLDFAWDHFSPLETRFEFQWASAASMAPPPGGGMFPGQPIEPAWSTVIVPADQLVHTHESAPAGALLYFRVRACNAGGCSAPSNELMITP